MFLVMEKPVFVVLRKYYRSERGVYSPFSPDGGDVLLFGTYEAAKENALTWCSRMARNVSTLCECGELPAAACQYDNLVMQCLGRDCYDGGFTRLIAEVYQKYVL